MSVQTLNLKMKKYLAVDCIYFFEVKDKNTIQLTAYMFFEMVGRLKFILFFDIKKFKSLPPISHTTADGKPHFYMLKISKK